MDEHLAGFCMNIEVTLEKDGSATVSDDGRGVPVGMHQKGVSAARIVYTTLHSRGKSLTILSTRQAAGSTVWALP